MLYKDLHGIFNTMKNTDKSWFLFWSKFDFDSLHARTNSTTSNEVTKWSHVKQKKLSVIGAYNDEHCWLNIWNLYIKNTDTINVLCIRLKIIWKYWQEQERSGRLLMCGSIFVLLITSPRHLSWLSDLR